MEGIACIAADIIVIGNGGNVEEATKVHDRRLLMSLKRYEDVKRSIKRKRCLQRRHF